MKDTQARGWRILHIDDDEDDYLLTREMLSVAYGQKVILDWAPSFEEGHRKLDQRIYDAVLVDYDLGVGTGVELIREFSERGYPAPLILFTGRGSREVDVEAMQAGATMYLTKSEANPLLLERSIRYAIERKQVEDQRRAGENKLQVALDAAQLGTWTYSYADDSLSMDERAQQLFHASGPSETLSAILRAHFHPDDIQPMLWQILSASDPGGTGRFQAEYRILQPDGSLNWFSSWGLVQFEGEGSARRALSLAGASRDITSEKQAHEDLLKSEQRFRAVLENMLDVAYRRDLRSNQYDYISPVVEQVLGFTPQEMGEMGMAGILAHIHPDERESVERAIASAEESGRARIRYRWQTKDGQYRWIADYLRTEKDLDGTPLFLSGMVRDITEQKQAEEKLRESEERFRTLAGASFEGIAISENGRVVEVNEQFARMHGYEGENLAGRPVSDFIALVDRERAMQNVLSEDETVNDYYALRKDGSEFIIEVRASMIQRAGRRLRVAVLRDITQSRQVEENLRIYAERLEMSNRALEDFAFIASHDLQEPLRKMRAFGHMLDTRFSEELGAEGVDYIARINKSADRMSAMLNGLLLYSRVAASDTPFERVDLNGVAEEVLSDLEARVMQTRGKVELEVLPNIEADPLQMQQLLQNLIGNALKYHRPGVAPQVKVTWERMSINHIRLDVADNGIGFEMKYVPRLFQPFQRLNGRSEYEGSGMGLAICRKIVEKHGGQIYAVGEPDRGAVFTVILPIQQQGDP